MQYGRATLGVDTESLKHITGIGKLSSGLALSESAQIEGRQLTTQMTLTNGKNSSSEDLAHRSYPPRLILTH